MSFKYRGITFVVFLLMFLPCVVCESTFDCFRDKCVRGQMYCVKERQRCYKCSDRIRDCRSDRLPRDCDAYCEKQKLESTVKSLNGTINMLLTQNHQLNESNTDNDVLILKLHSQLNKTRTDNANLRLEVSRVNDNLTDVVSRLNISERERDQQESHLDLLEKDQENMNKTYQLRLKSSEEEKTVLRNETQTYLYTVVGVSLLLVISFVLIVFLCVRQLRDKHQSSNKYEHSLDSMETGALINNEKHQQQRQPIDYPPPHPEAHPQAEPEPELGAKKKDEVSVVNNIHLVVIHENNPGEDKSEENPLVLTDKSGKRKSQDSGMNSDSSSGSSSSTNVDSESSGSKESGNLRHSDSSKTKEPMTEEIGCDCELTNKRGVRQCNCKRISQLPPTSNEQTALLPSSF